MHAALVDYLSIVQCARVPPHLLRLDDSETLLPGLAQLITYVGLASL